MLSLSKAAERQSEAQKELAKTISENTTKYKKLALEIAKLDEEGTDPEKVKRLRKERAKLNAEIGVSKDKHRLLNEEANKLHAEKVRKLERALSDTEDEATVLTRELKDAEKQANRLAEAGTNVGEKWSGGMRTASTGVTAAGAVCFCRAF